MATTILIIGESGSGKSTAIRTLNPKETILINVLDKPLPFKAARKAYKANVTENCNMLITDKWNRIITAIDKISLKYPDIKTIIIDDFQYIMANEFMNRANEDGWGKFTEIAQHAWKVIRTASMARSDLTVFFLSHSEQDQNGRIKCKTIGRMLDEKICLEGMFTIVLYSKVIDEKYVFQTQNDGNTVAKSPMGMFENKYISNDLQSVLNAVSGYLDEDIPQ